MKDIGIKYYSKSDLSIGGELKRAEPIIEAFDSNRVYTDINDILELFNIQELLETGLRIPEWTEEQYGQYKGIIPALRKVVAVFFLKIVDDNFLEYYNLVEVIYQDDFWDCFVRYKVYERISANKFLEYLSLPNTALFKVLQYKELVRYYGNQFAEIMRESEQTAEILASKYLEKGKTVYYIPSELKSSEYERIFLKYIESDDVRPRILQLIFEGQSSDKCPLSDKLRLTAKKAYEKFWANRSTNSAYITWGIKLAFQKQEELKKYNSNDHEQSISYDVEWFEENLDYPTVLNNFRYLFEMIDLQGRSILPAIQSQCGAMESLFRIDGIKFYPKNSSFESIAMLTNGQTSLYYGFLKARNIDLESIFKWFFEEYLPEEFNITGFMMSASSPSSTYLERCKNLASEMDGILKQFRMYAQDGAIDRELFEMSSGQIEFGTIPSLLQRKYAYPNNDKIKNMMHALFSDQSTLSYTEKTETKYTTLFELLQNEQIYISDFLEYQLHGINFLVEQGCLQKTDEMQISLAYPKAWILKDLYEHDVLCDYGKTVWTPIIDEMTASGDLRREATLFSEPESNYLNYVLNKSKYSNGLDLRNKYIHSTYPKEEKENIQDYMELLKIMVLIVTKINDEFCMRDEMEK